MSVLLIECVCTCCRRRSSRGTQILTRRSQSALGFGTASWAAKMVIFTYSNILLSVSMINMTKMRVVCGRERPFRLFEVLARNRQSALELTGRTRSAREQPPRLFTIPPRQQLSSTTWLAIRTWRVTHSIKSTQHTHNTHTHTYACKNTTSHRERNSS